jgi:hypothetical protein
MPDDSGPPEGPRGLDALEPVEAPVVVPCRSDGEVSLGGLNRIISDLPMILDGFFHLFNPILENEISWYLFIGFHGNIRWMGQRNPAPFDGKRPVFFIVWVSVILLAQDFATVHSMRGTERCMCDIIVISVISEFHGNIFEKHQGVRLECNSKNRRIKEA